MLGNQLLRCGTAVAGDDRAACRSRSHAEFISKMSIVVEEADKTAFGLELLCDTGVVRKQRLGDLQREAIEILAICAASLRTAKRNRA